MRETLCPSLSTLQAKLGFQADSWLPNSHSWRLHRWGRPAPATKRSSRISGALAAGTGTPSPQEKESGHLSLGSSLRTSRAQWTAQLSLGCGRGPQRAGVWAGQVPGSGTPGFLAGSLSLFGSRALTFSPVRAQSLAACLTGSPCRGLGLGDLVGLVGHGPGRTSLGVPRTGPEARAAPGSGQ